MSDKFVFTTFAHHYEKVKNGIKYILQRLLGFRRYLLVFSRFKIATLHKDKKEADFFVFMDILQDPKIILDIGANIGIMTVHLSKRFPNAQIHAIEPIPCNIQVLKTNIEYYKLMNVEIHEVAVGNEDSSIQMILPHQGKTKMQGLSHVKHESITEWNDGEEFDVPCVKLDNLFSTEKIDAIKLDVENFEFYTLSGGIEAIKRSKPVIYAELWDNENRVRCFELLTQIGYTTNVVDDGTLVPFDALNHNQQNFIFLIGE